MFGKEKNVRQNDFEIFTIYDTKTLSYEIPMFAINKHDMVRQLINMFKDPGQKNNKYLVNAEDFSLFKIAAFSKREGTIETVQTMEHVANLHDLRALAQPEPNVMRNVNEVQNQITQQ